MEEAQVSTRAKVKVVPIYFDGNVLKARVEIGINAIVGKGFESVACGLSDFSSVKEAVVNSLRGARVNLEAFSVDLFNNYFPHLLWKDTTGSSCINRNSIIVMHGWYVQ